MKTLVLINPRSGPARDRDALARLIDEKLGTAGIAFGIETCGPVESLDATIAQAVADGVERIVAVGGDGTVSEIGRRLVGTGLALALVPVGSGNGFARHLGIPLDPAAAVDALASATTLEIDTATVNGTRFLGVAGVGFDAVVAHRFATSTTRGLRTYVAEGLKALASYEAERYVIDVDGVSQEHVAFVAAVANSNQYGNDAKVAPLASIRDGVLDVSIIRQPTVLNAPILVTQLFTGSLHRSDSVTVATGRQISIRRETEGPAHIDGEPMILPAVLDFAIEPRSLRVSVPAGAADRI